MAKEDLKILRTWVDASISLNKKHLCKVNVKPVINEGDCLRCPNCGHIVYGRFGACDGCGEGYGS